MQEFTKGVYFREYPSVGGKVYRLLPEFGRSALVDRKECSERDTAKYIEENWKDIKKYIRFGLKVKDTDTVDELYQELYIEFTKDGVADFEPMIRPDGRISTIEDYVKSRCRNLLKRHYSKQNEDRIKTISNIHCNEDGEQIDLLDGIADDTLLDMSEYVTPDICKSINACRAFRYKFGIDIFEMLYVVLNIACSKVLDFNESKVKLSMNALHRYLDFRGYKERDALRLAEFYAENDMDLIEGIISHKYNSSVVMSLLENEIGNADSVRKAISF